MTHLNETLYCCGIACSSQGTKTKSGNYLIDLLLANVCKQNVTRFPYEIARLAQDLAGGIMVTQPSEADYRNPATHDYIEKYLKGVASVPTEDRMRLLRLIENMTMGTAAVGYLPESMHGAGSPQAQRIMIARQSNMEMKKDRLPARVHARRRLAAGTAHYDRSSVQHGNEEGAGEEDRAHWLKHKVNSVRTAA